VGTVHSTNSPAQRLNLSFGKVHCIADGNKRVAHVNQSTRLWLDSNDGNGHYMSDKRCEHHNWLKRLDSTFQGTRIQPLVQAADVKGQTSSKWGSYCRPAKWS